MKDRKVKESITTMKTFSVLDTKTVAYKKVLNCNLDNF